MAGTKATTIPKGDDCVALAKTLGTSVEYLVTGEEYSDEENEPVGIAAERNSRMILWLRTIADDPELYRVAKEIVMDRRKAQAFLFLIGTTAYHHSEDGKD
jgi:hypothetical protein